MARVGPIPRYLLMAQFLLKATKEKSPYIHVYIERFICLAFAVIVSLCLSLYIAINCTLQWKKLSVRQSNRKSQSTDQLYIAMEEAVSPTIEPKKWYPTTCAIKEEVRIVRTLVPNPQKHLSMSMSGCLCAMHHTSGNHTMRGGLFHSVHPHHRLLARRHLHRLSRTSRYAFWE